MAKKTPQPRTPRLTLAQLAAKQEELEQRIASVESLFITRPDTINEFWRRSDERVQEELAKLRPYLSRLFDAEEAKKHKA